MSKSVTVFALTTMFAGGTILTYLYFAGSGEEHLRQMLRLTAWSAIFLYLLIFVARPMQQLRGSMLTRKLLRNRRYVGIALAAMMTIHLVLLLIVNEKAFKISGAVVFTLMYLMLFTSFDSAPAKLGPRNWRLLHKTGLYALGIAYLGSIAGRLIKAPLDPFYLALTALMLAAIAIRITAFHQKRQRTAEIDSAM